ncbi:MAG: ATP-binding protein [Burkholderiaceae bacterium]
MRHAVHVPVPGRRETFWRTLQTFNITRIVIALVLLGYLSLDLKREWWVAQTPFYRQLCAAYLLLAVAFAMLAAFWRRRFTLQLTTQVTLDIGVIALLYVGAGGAHSGLAILFLFPLAGAAVLTALPLALFFVSTVTLLLLAEAGYQLLRSVPEVSTVQAGLYGAAFFAAVIVINQLAARLIKQELLAAQRGQDLQVQQAINRLVIADMGDGILVLGSDGTIFTANPAAERMLGLSLSVSKTRIRLKEVGGLRPIMEAFSAWLAKCAQTGSASNAPVFVNVKPGGATLLGATTVWGRRREVTAHLKLRFAQVETGRATPRRSVVFLQDVTEIESRAQQLKLASMGRLTASIAHEVRNPLSAIGHAATLLEEDATGPAERRLLRIVGDNVARMNRMIEDILKLSRKAQPQDAPLPLAPLLRQILEEFCESHALAPGLIALEVDGGEAWFDPLHLREVLVNLLGNALRYASGGPGSIRVFAVSGASGHLELHVQDDGAPMTPEVRAHLFEPFYTTSSKGTGLGLYLARELCLNNGALLDYEYRLAGPGEAPERASGRFVITFAAAAA